jgi:hypothetical protein
LAGPWPPIEAGVAALPARGDEIPKSLRNGQPLHDLLVRDRTTHQLDAHGLQRSARRFEIVLDFSQAECVSGLKPHADILNAFPYIGTPHQK